MDIGKWFENTVQSLLSFVTPESPERRLQRQIKALAQSTIPEITTSINVHKHYSTDEIMENGICFGLCLSTLAKDRWHTSSVRPDSTARVLHAAHRVIVQKKEAGSHPFPEKLLRKKGISLGKREDTASEKMSAYFDDPQSEEEKYVIVIDLGDSGHAIAVDLRAFAIMDPNICDDAGNCLVHTFKSKEETLSFLKTHIEKYFPKSPLHLDLPHPIQIHPFEKR